MRVTSIDYWRFKITLSNNSRILKTINILQMQLLLSNIGKSVIITSRLFLYFVKILVFFFITGFTPSQISQVQQRAEESNKRSSVGSILMSEWTKRDFSSVGVIIHALASINRLDLVALIQNSNSMKGSEIV